MKKTIDYNRAKEIFKNRLRIIENLQEPITHESMKIINESIQKTYNALFMLKTNSPIIDSIQKSSIARLKDCLFSANGHAECKELDTNFIKNFIVKDFREINHYFSNP